MAISCLSFNTGAVQKSGSLAVKYLFCVYMAFFCKYVGWGVTVKKPRVINAFLSFRNAFLNFCALHANNG